jgi:hypothetical protein
MVRMYQQPTGNKHKNKRWKVDTHQHTKETRIPHHNLDKTSIAHTQAGGEVPYATDIGRSFPPSFWKAGEGGTNVSSVKAIDTG